MSNTKQVLLTNIYRKIILAIITLKNKKERILSAYFVRVIIILTLKKLPRQYRKEDSDKCQA